MDLRYERQNYFCQQKNDEMLGYSEQQMMGKTPYEFMDEESEGLAKSNLERRLKGHSDRYEQKYIRKDVSTLWQSHLQLRYLIKITM